MASGRTAALILVFVGAAILVACVNGWSLGQIVPATTSQPPAEVDAASSRATQVGPPNAVVLEFDTGSSDAVGDSEANQAAREAQRRLAEAERAAQIAKQAEAKARVIAEMQNAKAAAQVAAARAAAAKVARSAKIAQARAESAKPARWEYKIFPITEQDYPAYAETRLNDLSEQGYELLTDAPPTPGTSYLLRRPAK